MISAPNAHKTPNPQHTNDGVLQKPENDNMTDTQAPERVWALDDRRKHWQAEQPQEGQHPWHWQEYVRADLLDARDAVIAELRNALDGMIIHVIGEDFTRGAGKAQPADQGDSVNSARAALAKAKALK